jgi:hypothetical protein
MARKYRHRNASAKVSFLSSFSHEIDVQAPAFFRPTDEEFFDPQDPSKPNVNFLKNHFYREGRLTEEQALFIIRSGTDILRREPNVLEVDAPITGPFLYYKRALTDP